MTKIYTNASGVATIDKPDGTYNFYVRKDGFASQLGSVTVSGAPVNKTVTMLVPGAIPYSYPGDGVMPAIKTSANYANVVYFDYQSGNNSNAGTAQYPFKDFNAKYSTGIPANTAFLFKRGSTHPMIGRQFGGSWTVYYNMVWNNNFVGAYGTGARPIIGGIWIIGNSSGNSPAGTRSDGVTLRDIHFYAESQYSWSWDNIIELHYWPNNVTVAYCILEGKHNPGNSWPGTAFGDEDLHAPYPYPCCGIRATGNGHTIYHNLIFNVAHDGIFLWSDTNSKVIRNYVHSVNRVQWGFGRSASDGTKVSVGDGIKVSGRCPGAYHAGNYVDPGKLYYDEFPSTERDWWKFAHIFTARETDGGHDGWLSGVTPGIIVEHNTFRTTPNGTVSNVVYFNPQPESYLRYNLIDRTLSGTYTNTGALLVSHYERLRDHLQQDPPYVTNNHLVKLGTNYTWPNYDSDIPASNELFHGWPAYLTFLETNDPVGSDIDPDNFWGTYTPPA